MEGRHEEAFCIRANHRGSKGSRCRAKVAELSRKYGISDAAYYSWKAKFL